MIQWNEKYLIYAPANRGAIGVLDIENGITSQMSLKQNQSSGENLPVIIGFKKIIDPKQGKSLIVISKILTSQRSNDKVLINLLSIK